MQKKLALAGLSGFLLTLAFPRWNLWPLAWGALVPLFFALDGGGRGTACRAPTAKESFLLGFTAGFVFFLLSISWLRHVTVFGMFFVVAVLALYWGVFGVVYSMVGAGLVPARRVRSESRATTRVAPTFFLAAAWVALEFIRTEIPVWGFGWNLLGNSQAPNLWIAQLASVGGVYSVSFLVFLGNSVIYRLLQDGIGGVGLVPALFLLAKNGFRAPLPARQPLAVAPAHSSLLVFFLLLLAVFIFGWSRMQTANPNSFFRVSILQGNIPQILKWDEAHKEEILQIYLNLTELASYDVPQLIVWPEAAYPGFFNRDSEAERVKALVEKIQIPLLVGSPHQEDSIFYNSAYLLAPSPLPSPPRGRRGREALRGPRPFSGEGEGGVRMIQRYDKIRLVPFGEYVPWKPVFGFLEPYAYALGVSDFSGGKELTVFNLEQGAVRAVSAGRQEPPLRFSVLICFEDTFPNLARRFVNEGANFLTVITNDAWFGRSSAPYQHLQASVFRAIENGVSIVRSANTGVSAFISPFGQVLERVQNQEGKDTFIMGGMTYPVGFENRGGFRQRFVAARTAPTLYRQAGWIFPYGCLAVLMLWGIKTSTLILIFLVFALTAGCIRLAGGAFYAKKGNGEKPPKVKEVYFDTDELLDGKEKAPGNIEI